MDDPFDILLDMLDLALVMSWISIDVTCRLI